MYIGKHIKCNTRALNEIAFGKFSHDTWLFSNHVRIVDFKNVCKVPGSQVQLTGICWSGERIPQSVLIYCDDAGQIRCRMFTHFASKDDKNEKRNE